MFLKLYKIERDTSGVKSAWIQDLNFIPQQVISVLINLSNFMSQASSYLKGRC